MDTIGRVLAATALFRGLSEEDLVQIRRIAVDKSFERTESVFSEGDAARGFYVVAEGRVKIFKLSPDGKEQILH
ncbi:MAG: cyclic nucleotide-binding domain-containing protein, partial [Desulfobacteraceae bacterium]|nr:cyclic nucleotide-binding domain-containing protein [Desulfobacteraceae bacterium]